MLSQASNKRSSCPQLQSQSLPHLSRLSLKLPPLFASPIASSKAQLPTLLVRNFERRVINTRDFLLTINAGHICCSIACYETHVESCLTVINGVCCCCGLFVWPLSLAIVLKSDPIIVVALKNQVINLTCLDHCGQEIDEYRFCLPCHYSMKQKKVPKFSSLNKVNVVMCQNYPPVLETLTLVEEMLIARCHPVMSILKLRPNGASSSVAYQRVRGHAVVFPQSPGPLSTILPSAVVKLHEHIRVVWFGTSKPDNSQLKSFVSVRRIVVLHALLWLGVNNILYKDVVINHEEMANWEDEFVPRSVEDNIVLSPSDHSEHQGYTHDLSEDNLENDMHAAISDSWDSGCKDGSNESQSQLVSGCVFSDIDGTRHHPVLKLISAVHNLGRSTNDDAEETEPLIVYSSDGRPSCLNDWEDEHYFTGAFPTLFPFGDGGHLTKRKTAISLKAWAKWAMEHHSRR